MWNPRRSPYMLVCDDPSAQYLSRSWRWRNTGKCACLFNDDLKIRKFENAITSAAEPAFERRLLTTEAQTFGQAPLPIDESVARCC